MRHPERVRLVKFGPEHLTEEYVSWLNDPETVKYSEQRHKTHTLESCRAYVEGRKRLYAIEVDGRHVGNVDIDLDANGIADIAILLGRDRNMGYGGAAFRLAVGLATSLGARKITIGTMADNKGMLRVAERAGMKIDGIRSRHFVRDGKEIDLVYCALFTDRPVQQ